MARKSLATENKELKAQVDDLQLRMSIRNRMPDALLSLAEGIDPKAKLMVDLYFDTQSPTTFGNGCASARAAGYSSSQSRMAWYNQTKKPAVQAYMSLLQAEMLSRSSAAAPAAVNFLLDVMMGEVKDKIITDNGSVEEIPASVRDRARAAASILEERRKSRTMLEDLIKMIIGAALAGKVRLPVEERDALLAMESPEEIIAALDGRLSR